MQKDKKQFLTAIWDMIDEVDTYKRKTARAKMRIVAHSILATLDGAQVGLNQYSVSATGSEFRTGVGMNISGNLHDEFYALGAKQKRKIE